MILTSSNVTLAVSGYLESSLQHVFRPVWRLSHLREVHNDDLQRNDHADDDVVLPCDRLESDGIEVVEARDGGLDKKVLSAD